MSIIKLDDLLDSQQFCDKQKLFLKPSAKIEININLPKMTCPGQSISNWDLMERLKKLVHPIQLEAIRVSDSSLEQVIFEAELFSRSFLKQVLKQLGDVTMKVGGFSDVLRVSSSEAKSYFPGEDDWKSCFSKPRLNADKPGERPDTLHITKVPVKWFSDGNGVPCEQLLSTAMSLFGPIRRVDIPCADPLRSEMSKKISGATPKTFGFGQEIFFDAYIQFDDYKGFLKAMDSFRDMKWVKEIEGKVYFANVKVDFDRTSHLTDLNIAKRKLERNKILDQRRKAEELVEHEKQQAEQKIIYEQIEKEKRREERERKRRQKYEEERIRDDDRKQKERTDKLAELRLRQHRTLQSQQLLECVFRRIQTKEDRLRRDEEDKIKLDMRLIVAFNTASEDKEEKLREMLLTQRELKMRENLKEKIRLKLEESHQNGAFREETSYPARVRVDISPNSIQNQIRRNYRRKSGS